MTELQELSETIKEGNYVAQERISEKNRLNRDLKIEAGAQGVHVKSVGREYAKISGVAKRGVQNGS